MRLIVSVASMALTANNFVDDALQDAYISELVGGGHHGRFVKASGDRRPRRRGACHAR